MHVFALYPTALLPCTGAYVLVEVSALPSEAEPWGLRAWQLSSLAAGSSLPFSKGAFPETPLYLICYTARYTALSTLLLEATKLRACRTPSPQCVSLGLSCIIASILCPCYHSHGLRHRALNLHAHTYRALLPRILANPSNALLAI